MKSFLVALLVASKLSHAAARSLRSGAAQLASAETQQASLLNSDRVFAGCQKDPATCSSSVSELRNLSETIFNRTLMLHNLTEHKIALVEESISQCSSKSLTRANSVLYKLAAKHVTCRETEQTLHDDAKQHEDVMRSAATDKTTQCENALMKRTPNAQVCKFIGSAQINTIGNHIESRKKEFGVAKSAYEKQSKTCQASKVTLSTKQENSATANTLYSNQAALCNSELTSLETKACLNAQRAEDFCKDYGLCYDDAIATLKSLRLADTEEALRREYKAGMSMECMIHAIEGEDKVNMKKVLECKKKSYNSSSMALRTPVLPKRETCPKPTLFPGTEKYLKLVNNGLPEGVKVSKPTPCLSFMGACAAKSTFKGSVVHLKRNGGYCGYSRTNGEWMEYKCGLPAAQRSQFFFLHGADWATTGSSKKTAVLVVKVLDVHWKNCDHRYCDVDVKFAVGGIGSFENPRWGTTLSWRGGSAKAWGNDFDYCEWNKRCAGSLYFKRIPMGVAVNYKYIGFGDIPIQFEACSNVRLFVLGTNDEVLMCDQSSKSTDIRCRSTKVSDPLQASLNQDAVGGNGKLTLGRAGQTGEGSNYDVKMSRLATDVELSRAAAIAK